MLPERMKIEKVEKTVSNLQDKTENVMHIKNLKQALNHGIIKSNQKAWLKPYTAMNTDLRKKQKMIFFRFFHIF